MKTCKTCSGPVVTLAGRPMEAAKNCERCARERAHPASHKMARPQGNGGHQETVLQALARGPITSRGISREMRMTPKQVDGALQGLKKRGRVVRDGGQWRAL